MRDIHYGNKEHRINLDQFTIALNGSLATADLNSIGVAIGTSTSSATVFASSTGSSTFSTTQDVAAQLAFNINQLADLTATLKWFNSCCKGSNY